MKQHSLTGDSPKLDFLRTVAVLMVTGAHLFLYLGDPIYLGVFQPSLLGPLGVVLFFVHTSLVLMLSLERQIETMGEHRWISVFYIRRIFRIYPLSIAAVLATYFFHLPLGELQAHRLISNAHQSVGMLAANLLLVQNFFKNSNLIGPLWSLPFEMQMYLVLPFCYLWARKVKTPSALHALWPFLALVAFTVVPKITKINGSLTGFEIPQFFLYIPCFWAGIIAYRAHWEKPKSFSFYIFPAAMVLFSVAFMLSYDKIKYIFVAYACGALLPWVGEPSSLGLKKTCQWVARYSYGIYLFHYVSMWFGFEVLKGLPGLIQWGGFTSSLLVLSVGSYHLLEKPFIRIGQRVAMTLGGHNRSSGNSTRSAA